MIMNTNILQHKGIQKAQNDKEKPMNLFDTLGYNTTSHQLSPAKKIKEGYKTISDILNQKEIDALNNFEKQIQENFKTYSAY